jgi:hypothetical protein
LRTKKRGSLSFGGAGQKEKDRCVSNYSAESNDASNEVIEAPGASQRYTKVSFSLRSRDDAAEAPRTDPETRSQHLRHLTKDASACARGCLLKLAFRAIQIEDSHLSASCLDSLREAGRWVHLALVSQHQFVAERAHCGGCSNYNEQVATFEDLLDLIHMAWHLSCSRVSCKRKSRSNADRTKRYLDAGGQLSRFEWTALCIMRSEGGPPWE